jgi:hypothetical protein
MSGDMEWVDEEAGPVVRPYAMTGGRTAPSAGGALDLMAVVTPTGAEAPPFAYLGSDHRRLLALIGRSRHVAELAAELGSPVGVVRVLLGDLLEHGLIRVRPPLAGVGSPSERLLREVIDGLRAL